jgi:dihydrofolate synthase/folylpolyglutamate synthase
MDGQIFDLTVEGTVYNGLSIRLLGEYQLLNAKTAVTAIHTLTRMGIGIGKDAIYDGLKNTCWPGRLEVMGREPLILLDGAHNLQGITGLKDALKKYFSYDRLILVIGVLRDKQVEDMCRAIMPLAETIVTVAPNSERAMSAGQLASIASCYCKSVTACDSIDDAYKTGRILAQNNDLLLFCGSLYMIGHIRSIVKR